MDTSQWLQEIAVKPMEEILVPISNNSTQSSNSKENNGNGNTTTCSLEKKMRPQKAQAVNCPRCNSTNTKFCYYNNYSQSQPRYFCKTCRRYWTEGGSLRNIPVGGGSRKNNKKTSSSNIPSSSSKKQTPTTITTITTATTSAHDQNPNPKMHDQGQDLNLGCFPMTQDFKTISQLIQVPDFENSGSKSHFSALELLTRGCGNSNNSPYIPSMYSEGFSSLPTLGFSLDGIGNSGYGSVQGVEESGNSGRALFPFEDLKQVSSTNHNINDNNNNNNNNMEVNNRDQQGDSTGYWNGILGGGSW